MLVWINTWDLMTREPGVLSYLMSSQEQRRPWCSGTRWGWNNNLETDSLMLFGTSTKMPPSLLCQTLVWQGLSNLPSGVGDLLSLDLRSLSCHWSFFDDFVGVQSLGWTNFCLLVLLGFRANNKMCRFTVDWHVYLLLKWVLIISIIIVLKY